MCFSSKNIYTLEHFKWNNFILFPKFYIILFYYDVMKQKGDDYKLTAVEYYLNNEDTMDNICKIFDCKKP